MANLLDPRTFQKLSLIWSSRRERAIAVRIEYSKEERDGCKIYTLKQVDEVK